MMMFSKVEAGKEVGKVTSNSISQSERTSEMKPEAPMKPKEGSGKKAMLEHKPFVRAMPVQPPSNKNSKPKQTAALPKINWEREYK